MKKAPLVACLLAFSTSCVTVNVNFPESAVQKATDDYVRDLYRAKEKGKQPQASPAPAVKSTSSAELLWEIIVPSAQAGDDLITAKTPAALAIQKKQLARIDSIIEQKKAGLLGEKVDGTLVIKDPSKLKPGLKMMLENLVKDENADRSQLYQEILKANGLPGNRLQNVERSFSRSFQAESPSGTWVENPDGSWSQKP